MNNYGKHIVSIFLIGKINKTNPDLNQLTNLQDHPIQQEDIHALEEIILTHAFADFLINYILTQIRALLSAKQFAKLTFGLSYGSNIAYHQIIY